MNLDSRRTAVLNISQILFEAEIQTHIIHLLAKDKSYSQHQALGEFYESLGDMNDDLVEKYQGKYSPLNGYKSIPIKDYIEPIIYLTDVLKRIEASRKSLQEGYLEQLVDNIIEQIAKTLYKLKNLK
jgi:DNA-binding ferritin-like protein